MNRVLFCTLIVVSSVGCNPLGGRGDSCDNGPCASGLVCTDDNICGDPPPPPPPPCEGADDCALNGDASGRACVDGVCGFLDCNSDFECGNRICVNGACEGVQPCLTDNGCRDGDLCIDSACRPPCQSDDECGAAIGGFALQVCLDGECRQRCLNDATCFNGSVCDANVCVTPECNDFFGCSGDNVECVAGRCATYTPCVADDGCFDPNLRCDLQGDPPRCVERPACFNDAVCGFDGLCITNHCRPVTGCFAQSDCADDDECLGGRCVSAPACRAAVDCDADEVCANLRCVAGEAVEVSTVLVADAASACDGCRRVLVVGESTVFTTQGYDDAGLPVLSALDVRSSDRDVAAATVDGSDVVVDALELGAATIDFATTAAQLTVIEPASSSELLVLIVDDNGGPVEGVTVTVTDDAGLDRQRLTDSEGAVRFDGSDVTTGILARAVDGRGVALAGTNDVAGTSWRLPLPAAAVVVDSATPVRVTVASTGDELGPVGLGLALGSLPRSSSVSLAALLGDDVAAQLALPVIGTIPVTVPSALTLTATLPLVGDQVLRAAAEVVVVDGPAFVLALEGRRDNNTLTGLALGGDLSAFALELFEQSESLDALLAPLGTLAALPLVVDSADRDGDGNTNEAVADYDGGLQTTISPSQTPTERSSVVVRLPDGISEAVVVAAFDLPGRVVPAGVGIVRGAQNFEGLPLPESFKAVSSSAALSRARRIVVVSAVTDDAGQVSRLTLRGQRLPVVADLGALLSPPDGAFVVDNLPVAGARSVLVASEEGGDLVRVSVVDSDGVVDVYAGSSGAVPLPSALRGTVRLQQTSVMRIGGLQVLRTAAGPVHIDDVASAFASAR